MAFVRQKSRHQIPKCPTGVIGARSDYARRLAAMPSDAGVPPNGRALTAKERGTEEQTVRTGAANRRATVRIWGR